MNKKIKKIITFTLICAAFSTFMSSTMNIGNQYAYAYSNDEISNLGLTTSTGIIIPIYNSVSNKEKNRVKKYDKIPIVIYSKLASNQDNIKLSTIEADAKDIRVFVGTEKVKLADINSVIKFEKGEKKSIYIRLYDSKNDFDSSFNTEYQLNVEREVGDDNDTIEDTVTLKDYDDVYLTQLSLSSDDKQIDLNFNKEQAIYNVTVDQNIKYLRIKAVPEQDNYRLTINDKDVDTKGSNKNVRTEALDEDKTLIKIRIVSTDHKRRDYYLNVTKNASKTSTTDTTSSNTINPPENNISQYALTNGVWQFKKTDGTIATGWTNIGNQLYYFDETGAMKTGWLKDASGKWYYLNAGGDMAKNTTVDGYKIGTDGVCVGK
ncbi:cadherin-like beta sandwich domain-containing protein [Clostridium saccharoperbutylacetonicum]|uniref:cadherin-like beta sandwich domain-containing protein n=1 Tax=Clostridium saccharoperbutylacetonicum TaxID=36745 RepID=UPI000983C480|nr:cadherin-like beta sandwich domain-containing protein [Clostridium saccharoperbutylacetonicum]AQR97816.1 autolysin [Clostridium saccharoperbutylacetonicum]NSB33706.1 glucan-binding YG repeat protein [Clostridium saccharoperbutylacetonicum]